MATWTRITAGLVLSLALTTLADDNIKPKCKDLKHRRLEKIKKFKLYTEEKVDWHGAFKKCNSMDMELATIDNEEEFDAIVGLIKNTEITKADFWTSGSDNEEKEKYVWETSGEEFSYFNWAPGEPTHTVQPGGVESCVELWSAVNFQMNDIECIDKNYPVCQYYEYTIVEV